MNTLIAAKMKIRYNLDDDDIAELDELEIANPAELRDADPEELSAGLLEKLAREFPQ